MTRRLRQIVLRDPEQHEAIASPTRQEIIEHFGVIGPASVREVAQRMDRSPHALHYHVRRLVDLELLRAAGSRRRGTRTETLYDVSAETFVIEGQPDVSPEDRAEVRVIRAALRSAERDYVEFARSDPGRLQCDDSYAARMRARLPAGARRDVARHLKAIQRIFETQLRRDQSPHAKLETVTFTAVLLPEP